MLAVLVALMLSSCDGGSGKTAALLDEVEGYMQQRPDSALSVLTAIPQESLRSDRLRARWSLLYAMALDKNWIDTTDISVVMPAVEYYDRHRPLTNRAKPHYYLGRIQFNGRNYEEAILSFTQAGEYAAKLEDPRFKSLIFQALADTYSCTYLHEDAVAYSDSSYRYCLLAKDTMLANSSLFAVAKGYMNLSRYAEADSVFSLLLQDGKIYPQVYPRVLADYGLLQTVYQENYPLAVEYFDKALETGGGFSHTMHWGAYAYSLNRIGMKEKSQKVFDWLERKGQTHTFSFQKWNSRVSADNNDFRQAFDCLQNAFDIQTENYEKLVKQSTVKAQRDYAIARQEAAESHVREQRLLFFLLFMALIAASAIVYAYVKTRNLKLAAENDNLREIAETVEKQLESENTLHKEETQKLREDYVRRNKEYFKTIGQLCEAYLSSEDERASKRTIKRIRELASLVKDDSHQLENELNEKLDNVISDFKADYPEITDNHLQLVCYLFAGFDATTISLLTGKSKEALYTQKSRIKSIISDKDCKDKDRYLLLVGYYFDYQSVMQRGRGNCLIINVMRAFSIYVRYLFCAIVEIGLRRISTADFAFLNVRFFQG
jgi:hypothetical protein